MNVKLIVVAGCFVAGTGAGTFWSMRGAPDTAGHGTEAADSTHAEVGDSTHAEPAQDDGHAAAVEELAAVPAHDATQDTTHAAQPETHEPPVAAAPTPTATDTLPASGAEDGTARLARIFGAMRPEEAARLLEPLPEGDVRAVLLSLSERKAAAILANFKGERASALTRALISHGRGH